MSGGSKQTTQQTQTNTIDPAHVARLVISIDRPAPGQAIELSNIHAGGEGRSAPVAPMSGRARTSPSFNT